MREPPLLSGAPSTTAATPQSTNDTSLPSISGGNYIWFNSTGLNVQGLPANSTVKLYVTNASIKFTANGTPYTLPVADAVITFSPTATSASASWDSTNNRWNTLVPTSMVNGNTTIHTFLDGLAFLVPSTFPGLPVLSHHRSRSRPR